jgi:hypothetical protein
MLTKAINTETKLANTIKSACISPEYKPRKRRAWSTTQEQVIKMHVQVESLMQGAAHTAYGTSAHIYIYICMHTYHTCMIVHFSETKLVSNRMVYNCIHRIPTHWRSWMEKLIPWNKRKAFQKYELEIPRM